MTWEILKDKIYYFDGAWLDIYVLDATREDWNKWAKYVNENYELRFYNCQTDSYESKIDLSVITNYWNNRNEDSDTNIDLIFKLSTIDIKCHFSDDTQIENDFDPGDINTIDDHYKIVSYMTDISNLLSKTLISTPENNPAFVYISVNSTEVKINAY